jgi:hypothetical protein
MNDLPLKSLKHSSFHLFLEVIKLVTIWKKVQKKISLYLKIKFD